MIFNTPFLPVDNLSRFMLLIVAFLFPLIFIYSFSYVKRNLFRYYFVLFIALGGMLGVVLARDLLSFYVFLEVMTVGIYFLIIDNAKKESFPAGFKYVLMMFAGGIFILLATLLLYNLTGTFEIAEIAKAAKMLPGPSIAPIFALFAIGCLLEIGAVPFHIWLPDAHPIAPSPISALLSGIAIKVGAYAIIRMLFTLDILSPALVWIGAISMLFGVLLALKQTNVKRLLAYHSISQMGYVLLGIGIGSGIGIGGALFHILNHAVFKMLLFLCMGAIIYVTGERELNKLGGLAKRMPVTLLTFGVAALAIAGLPPFNGFASKAMISGAAAGNLWLKLVVIITAAGTFASFVKLFRFSFLGSLPVKLKDVGEAPALMLFPMLVLAAACFGLGLYASPLLSGLIAPAAGRVIEFNFWSAKLFLDAFWIVFLGAGIYILGMKTDFFGATEINFGLDWVCCNAAKLLERGCAGLKKLQARMLNAHLFWVFVALILILIVIR